MRSPERRKSWIPNALVLPLVGMGIAYLIHEGVANGEQRQVEPSLPRIGLDAGASGGGAPLPDEKPAPGFTKEVHEYLEAHDAQFRAVGKNPMLVITELVRIKVKEAEVNKSSGIIVRHLPDTELGQPILTTGESKPPYWKVLPPGSKQGVFDKFVLMQDIKTKQVDVWVARHPEGEQTGLEFFAIHHNGEDLIDMHSESSDILGQPLSVQSLLERFLPADSTLTPDLSQSK